MKKAAGKKFEWRPGAFALGPKRGEHVYTPVKLLQVGKLLGTVMMPADEIAGRPEQEAIAATLEAHEELVAAAGAVNEDALPELARKLRESGAYQMLLEVYLFDLLFQLYLWRLESLPGPNKLPKDRPWLLVEEQHGEPVATVDYDRREVEDLEEIMARIRGLFAPALEDDAFWLELARQAWTHLAAWTLRDLKREMGPETLQTMPEEEFDRLFWERMDPEALPYYLSLHAQDLVRNIIPELPRQASLEMLEWFLGLRKERLAQKEAAESASIMPLPRLPDAFPDGKAHMAANPLVAACWEAIMKGGKKARLLQGGWEASSTGAPLYQHVGRRGGRIIAYPDPPRGPLDPIPTVEKLWEFVESLSPFTGDVALAVLAQMGEPSQGDRPRYPLLQPVKINADAILRYKGLQRYGMERRLLRERVAEEMRRLQGLRFDVEKFPVYNPETRKWEGKGQSWRGDRLFDIVEVEQYQPDFWGGKQQVEIAWSVRAGQWAYYWLNAQGRAYVARMARALLELDHRENRAMEVMAKKIGQRVALLSYGGNVLEFRIGKLLEDIGELIAPDKRPKDWAGRTKERFDEAMLALKQAGIFSDVHWPDGYGPGDSDRSRGWPERWLGAKVMITLPEQAPEPAPEELPVLLPARKRPGRKPAAKEQRIDGAALRRIRTERNWRQDELAQRLGISKGYLSAIETGKRLPSPALAARIRAWMEQESAN